MPQLPEVLIDAAAHPVVMHFGGRPQHVRQEVEEALGGALRWLNDPANLDTARRLLAGFADAAEADRRIYESTED